MVICGKKDLRWNGVFDQELHLDVHRLSMLITYVFCLVICIGKVVTRRACGWRTRQFPHLQPPFPLQILPRKSIKSFFLAFVVLVDISRSHPVHTSFRFIRFSMRFGRFSERFLLCERGARSSYSNHSAAEPPPQSNMAPMRRRSGQKGRVLREPSSPARTVEFCLREPSSPARTVESCANRRVLRDPSSPARTVEFRLREPSSSARTVEFCANRRVLREPSSSARPVESCATRRVLSARTVESCANRRVLREPSSPARTVESCANRRVLREPSSPARTVDSCAIRRVLRDPSSPARTVESCANFQVLRERDTLVTTENSVAVVGCAAK